MTSHEQFTKRCSPSLNIQKKKRGLYLSTQLSGCMWTWKFCLTAYKGFLKISRCKCQMWVTTLPGLAWLPPGFISVPWKSRFGSDVDSKETTAGVRSGCVWVRASVPLWACWWHHKPLNQCFTAPGHSGGFCCCVRFFKYKVLQTKTERILSSAV